MSKWSKSYRVVATLSTFNSSQKTMKTKKYSRAAKSVKQKKPMKSMWSMKPKCMAKKRCKMVSRIYLGVGSWWQGVFGMKAAE